jgi:radical SAM protein with 4Fe4S-binding SPASM domain
MCVFEETCGLGLALEHNGDLYSCDHFVEPDYLLGNIIVWNVTFALPVTVNALRIVLS